MTRIAVFPANTYLSWISLLCLALFLGRLELPAQTYHVKTIASGPRGYSGDGGSALSASYGRLGGLAATADGTVYVADTTNYRVRVIAGGIVRTAVGTGNNALPSDTNQLPLQTNLWYPNDVEVGSDGQLYIADSWYIRRWNLTNTPLVRVAGTSMSGGSSADGTLAAAAFIHPRFLAVDSTNQPVFTEPGVEGPPSTVRMIENGRLWTYVGGGNIPLSPTTTTPIPGQSVSLRDPRGVAVLGNYVYICEYETGIVARAHLGTPNRPTTTAALLRKAQDITAGRDGRLYVLWEPLDGVQRISSFNVLPNGTLGDQRHVVGGGLDGSTNDIPGNNVSISNSTNIAVSPNGQVYYNENFGVSINYTSTSRIRVATPTVIEPCEFRTQPLLPTAMLGVFYETDILYSSSVALTQAHVLEVRNQLADIGLSIDVQHDQRRFRISGTPNRTGEVGFQLTLPCDTFRLFRLTIEAPKVPLEILPTELRPATQGCPYSAVFSASGGSAPYSIVIPSGPISPQARFLEAPATVSVTPTQAGTFPVTIQASDTLSRSGSRNYQFVVNPPVSITTRTLPSGQVSRPYQTTLTAQGGGPGLRWSAPLPLPAGLRLEADGILSGTPTAPFNGPIALAVSDAYNCGSQIALPLVIEDLPETLPESLSLSFNNDAMDIGEDYVAGLTLNPAPSKSHEGSIRIEFIPIPGSGMDTNPEVVFLTQPASRSQRFQISPSTTSARFPDFEGGNNSIPFRTGTVAGTIRLTAELAQFQLKEAKDIPIPAQPPILDDLSVIRSGSQLKIRAEGFASERVIGSGIVKIGVGADTTIEQDGSKQLPEVFLQDFTTYFATPEAKEVGSQFVLNFEVDISNGQASQISEFCLRLDGRQGMTGQTKCVAPR